MSYPSFLDRIVQAGRECSDRPALVTGSGSYTYAELFACARGIRERLDAATAGGCERIGIVTGDDVETYASILAAWSAGAAYVPLNVNHPPDRNARVIEQAGLDVILTSRDRTEWASHLPEEQLESGCVSTQGPVTGSADLAFPEAGPESLAYILFTSGSTGTPKGVPISHGNLSAFIDTVLDGTVHRFDDQDRFLQMFELTFDLSVVSYLAPWSVGACCCVVPEKGIAYMNILGVLDRQQVTIALMVPSVLPYMQRFFEEVRFPHLRLNQFCGEALTQDMVAEWSQCVPNAMIENVYGPTEATIYCTRYEWIRDRAAAEAVNGVVPVGEALPRTQAVVVNDNGEVCAPGEKGELCLAGDQVMQGYWRAPEITAASFVSVSLATGTARAYRTGDIAYVNENGNLVYCGRIDSQVKIDGHRIELGEIEHFARQFIGSSAAAVIVAKDRSGLDRLVLFVGDEGIDREAMQAYFKTCLPAYMWPTSITLLPELPLNLNGKIDRPALRQMEPAQT